MTEKQEYLLAELLDIINDPKADVSDEHDGCMGSLKLLDKYKLIYLICNYVQSNKCTYTLNERN